MDLDCIVLLELPWDFFLLSQGNENNLKKGYMEMTDVNFLETQKKCPGSLYFTLI